MLGCVCQIGRVPVEDSPREGVLFGRSASHLCAHVRFVCFLLRIKEEEKAWLQLLPIGCCAGYIVFCSFGRTLSFDLN